MGAQKQDRLFDLSVSRTFFGSPDEDARKRTVPFVIMLNSARRVKCDEAKPACKKCVSGGRTCQGYEDPFVASSPPWQAKIDSTSMNRRASTQSNKERQVSVSRQSAIKAVSPFRVPDLEPFECDFAQCAKYYFEIVHPTLLSNFDHDKNVRVAACNIRDINRPRFIIHATAEYLNRVSVAQNALPSSSLLPAVRGQWNKFHRYALEVVQDVNQSIERDNRTPLTMTTVLVRIFSLINAELYMLGPSWRAHMIGFLAFVKMKWTLGGILKSGMAITSTTWILTNAIIVNTTSPASNQIMPVYEFPLDEIEAVFSLRFYSELPCPTVLFLCMHRITKLRMRLADGEPAATIQPLAEIILDTIEAFDAETWSEPYGVPENPVVRVLARAYQAAVRLYAIMTMPPCLSVVTGEIYRKAPARDELMGLIREVLPQLESKVALHWCLPVAGVALADGPVEDQEVLEYIFMGLKQDVEFYLPFHIRDTLRTFWESGSTGWEDCWTEPYPPLC
ncbi:hypothetical protein NLG97_g5284 [Lecanicillium saksenae]|uniref:Uncharacterized protein n=1 Tax=Lecanicillium saksenae TaxID=468837 RepID=A0ACC1QVA0_9HYPO|nr:hypothetical protein NLG97_g5284 [Lecanicillium saksenae]